MKIRMRGFSNRKPLEDTPQRKICEALLELAEFSEVKDLQNGRRIFTVKRMPDNVPMADIYWEEDNSEIKFNLKGEEG